MSADFATSTRRLPGLRFETQSPPSADSLPRMDVAVFAGFAASGPINRPVAIEDSAQFTAIFGADAALAWDMERGLMARAYLGPAVRDFFRQGGRRCWVVRVAGAARYNYFPVPALLELRADGKLAPAFARARSEGSWSDALRAGTRLQAQPVEVTRASFAGYKFELRPQSPGDLKPGDLLRFNLRDQGLVLYAVVKLVAPSEQEVTHRSLKIECVKPAWFSTQSPEQLPPPSRVLVYDKKIEGEEVAVTEQPAIHGLDIKLKCALTLAGAPAPGTLMSVDFDQSRLWLTVRESKSIADGSHLGSVQIEGRGLWLLDAVPVVSPDATVEVERLSFDLLVQEGGAKPQSLNNLGFHESHARFWGDWPTDEQRYENMPVFTFATPNTNRELFPLAARGEKTNRNSSREVYLPLAMPLLADSFTGAISQSQSALERDGLHLFGSDLFLDPSLRDVSLEDLMSQADYLRYQSSAPRALQGIHAALDIEEATIIAVPDAVQRGWTLDIPAPTPPEPPSTEIPAREDFIDCGLRDLVPPDLRIDDETPRGTISLQWSSLAIATRYVVEESRSPSWTGAEVVYSGAQTRVVLYGRTEGDYFYRVRAESKVAIGNWSHGVHAGVGSSRQWRMEPAESYSPAPLLAVHHALLRMCAARGDLFAVLAVPEHYREDEAITHADLLRPANNLLEQRAAGYGALYHPWLISRRDVLFEPWQVVPPDGAASGVMARRAIALGAWNAPANELLRGVISLAPPLAAARRLDLQQARINIFRREPRGFLSLGADTLSHEADLRPINVRRLLILLRRLALRLGANYVFEPNDDSFRRLVQRGFEAALQHLFERGAFAGATPATSYQVVTDASSNTQTSMDQGRFIVELRVAPSLPLTFITIRLVQTNDRLAMLEVR